MENLFEFLFFYTNRLEATNQLLRDEHQALHLAYSALEEKQQRLIGENKELLQRYIEIKTQHADIMNQENENFVKYAFNAKRESIIGNIGITFNLYVLRIGNGKRKFRKSWKMRQRSQKQMLSFPRKKRQTWPTCPSYPRFQWAVLSQQWLRLNL